MMQVQKINITESNKKIKFPGAQLPLILALSRSFDQLSREKPGRGQKFLRALWDTYYAFVRGAVPESEKIENSEEYAAGLGVFFDGYFTHFGDFKAIEKGLMAHLPEPPPVVREALEKIIASNMTQLLATAEELEKVVK